MDEVAKFFLFQLRGLIGYASSKCYSLVIQDHLFQVMVADLRNVKKVGTCRFLFRSKWE